ncbi:MAG: hypothetical protein P4K98_06265 [Bryobacteraceae bacterium]|nr:hypothetical protein [Bryobacteraceae bacterium]
MTTYVFRPKDANDPLRLENRILKMPALFSPPKLRQVHAAGYGGTVWHGTLDAAYVQPGDYLACGEDVWFVAAKHPLEAPLCIRTLRRLSFTRPSGSVTAGATLYGGVVRSATPDVLTRWPAAVMADAGGGQIALATSSAVQQMLWTVLLPPQEWLGLQAGDAMRDDLGRFGVVETAERTDLGWHLLVRQSTA